MDSLRSKLLIPLYANHEQPQTKQEQNKKMNANRTWPYIHLNHLYRTYNLVAVRPLKHNAVERRKCVEKRQRLAKCFNWFILDTFHRHLSHYQRKRKHCSTMKMNGNLIGSNIAASGIFCISLNRMLMCIIARHPQFISYSNSSICEWEMLNRPKFYANCYAQKHFSGPDK